MLKLVIKDDEGKTTVVPLVRDEITIGREEGNTIRLTERNVSRHHARLRAANGSVTIEDLKSYNGIRVNGDLIEGETSLGESDRVQIGDYLIELSAEAVERADSDQATQRIEPVEGAEVGADTAPSQKPIEHTAPLPALDPRPAAAPVPDGGAAALDTQRSSPPPQPAAGSAYPAPAAELAAAHSKLVVLSKSFAGREFVLDKPSLVIGRTEDNDICVDHRSISRHHAKIVREGGRYAVVDLQSSNGVRVNGEEYGKVELRRGDVVDLGHVRMRYVETGEDFVFGRDAQPVDLEAGRRRGAVWAIAAVVAIGGGAGVFALAGGGGGASTEEADTPVAVGDGDEGTPGEDDPLIADDAATELAPDPDEDDVEQLRAHIEAASDAVADDRWEEVRDEASAALELDPEDERAIALVAQAESELENRQRYESFRDAVEAGDFREVARTFSEIDRESVYRVKGQPEHDRMRDEYVERVQRRARLAARRGECDQLNRIAADARGVWPEAGAAASGVRCRRRVADSGEDARPDPSPPDEQDDPDGPDPSPPARSVDELVAEAQAAARVGEFGRSLRLCEDALRRSRGHSEALMTCLISACNLRNVSKARRYMSQISDDRRNLARQVCLRHGLDVE